MATRGVERFERSLYDLIRGLRNHKGRERDFIQNSLRECRQEIKGPDMDVKATALLKLVYLEMFGYDMSWASFNVLEVMASPRYLQKRVGYLGAIQSFRPDTDVLMLATNLLKKDISSHAAANILLSLVTLPHVCDPSLAISLHSDLLPRLSHSNAEVRKKTVASLYRLGLVYPELLRAAWPKIRALLMDEMEDPSVTSSVVNVICELGRRRPTDFLSFAPRLFELLVDGRNNWMAIKIVKLFASLTPLEPRLVKKLLPPLTQLIRTTPAMSLLYECINGAIQGGILRTGLDNEGEELASLCVDKLRGMVVADADPNLKYVALLAFGQIATSYPQLVSDHRDVIMSCFSDSDVSIRLRAIELGVQMATPANLKAIVQSLLELLRGTEHDSGDDHKHWPTLVDNASNESFQRDGENRRSSLNGSYRQTSADYHVQIMYHIVEMCSRDSYSNVVDFDWYVLVLLELAQFPSSQSSFTGTNNRSDAYQRQVYRSIGWQLRNIAIRVISARAESVKASTELLSGSMIIQRQSNVEYAQDQVLTFAAWIVGEYSYLLTAPESIMESLLRQSAGPCPKSILVSYLQAISKVFREMITKGGSFQSVEGAARISSIISRIINVTKELSLNSDIEVQDRAVQLYSLMKIVADSFPREVETAASATEALKSIVQSFHPQSDLNPVAATAQQKVPSPDSDLTILVNYKIWRLIGATDSQHEEHWQPSETSQLYFASDSSTISKGHDVESMMKIGQKTLVGPETGQHIQIAPRHQGHPFYIEDSLQAANAPKTQEHSLAAGNTGEHIDLNSIPIMDLERTDEHVSSNLIVSAATATSESVPPNRVAILQDESPDWDTPSQTKPELKPSLSRAHLVDHRRDHRPRAFLQVDSSTLDNTALETPTPGVSRNETGNDDAEVSKALAEIEHLRLEMQRAAERVQAQAGTPLEGTLVKKKRSKRNTPAGRSSITASKSQNLDGANEKERHNPKKRKPKAAIDAVK